MKGESQAMSRVTTSLDEYSSLIEEKKRRTLEPKEVEHLLEVMKEELVVLSSSPLLGAAYNSCASRCESKFRPTFFCKDGKTFLKHYDAYCLIVLLSQYIADNSAFHSNLCEVLPDLFISNASTYVEAKAEDFDQALISIDAAIPKIRKEMYQFCLSAAKSNEKSAILNDAGIDAGKNESNTPSPTMNPSKEEKADNQDALMPRKDKTQSSMDSAIRKAEEEAVKIVEHAKKEAERVKSEAVDTAQKEARKEKQGIVEAAKQEAREIIERASREAERNLSEAKNRFADMVKSGPAKAFEEEQRIMEDNFSAVRKTLVDANRALKDLEESFSEANTRKISAQLLELFNIVSDSKKSAFELARQNKDHDLENAAYNMDVFLDMIIEYMADYGILPIASAPGDRFSGKHHEIIAGDKQFDPRTTTIKVSKRTGFRWGEQVLQKEQVEI